MKGILVVCPRFNMIVVLLYRDIAVVDIISYGQLMMVLIEKRLNHIALTK